MPRVENLGSNVQEWYEDSYDGSSTHDVCASCHEELELDPHVFDEELKPYNGDPQGEDGWGGEVEHPPYSECEYTCVVCGKELTGEDD